MYTLLRSAVARGVVAVTTLAMATAGLAGATSVQAVGASEEWQPSTPLFTTESRAGLVGLPAGVDCRWSEDRVVTAAPVDGELRAVLRLCVDRELYYLQGSPTAGYTVEKAPMSQEPLHGPRAMAADGTGTYFLVSSDGQAEVLKRSQDGEYRPSGRRFPASADYDRGFSLAAHRGRWWAATNVVQAGEPTHPAGRKVQVWGSTRERPWKISPDRWAAVGAPKIAYSKRGGLVVAYAAVHRPTRNRADWTYAPVIQRLVDGRWTRPKRLARPARAHKFSVESLALPGSGIEVAFQKYSDTVGSSLASWTAKVFVAERRGGTWTTTGLKTHVRTPWNDDRYQDERPFEIPDVTFHPDPTGVRIALVWESPRVAKLKSRGNGAWRTKQLPVPDYYHYSSFPVAAVDAASGTTLYYRHRDEEGRSYLAVLTSEHPAAQEG